ncbi:MAG: hypothetical protein K0S42_1922 [Microvirga sp.]|nr:hypothetical protein [Microvirga sp.]
MVGTRWHRLLILLLVGLALGWPLLNPVVGIPDGAASAGASMPDGRNGCDPDPAEDESCPTVLCAVPPANVPALSFDPAGAKADGFTLADESLRGRIPEIYTPPPRMSPGA